MFDIFVPLGDILSVLAVDQLVLGSSALELSS